MAILSFIQFCYKNYTREHKYLIDLIVIIVFILLFEGFMISETAHDSIWLILPVFAIVLHFSTARSLYFFEHGNTLHFLVSKPYGRWRLLTAKALLVVLIDLTWVGIFAILYGLRFPSTDYWLFFPLRMLLIAWMLLIASLLFGLSYTWRPGIIWFTFLITVLGFIVNKAALFPVTGFTEAGKLLAFLLPPYLEMLYAVMELRTDGWTFLFLGIATLQTALLVGLNRRKFYQKDLI